MRHSKLAVTLILGLMIGYGIGNVGNKSHAVGWDVSDKAHMFTFNEDGAAEEMFELLPVCVIKNGKKIEHLTEYERLGKPQRDNREIVTIRLADDRIGVTCWVTERKRWKQGTEPEFNTIVKSE